MPDQLKTPPARPTIQDVASAAGVSTGTVSRVLNNRAGVRVPTRERVLRVVAQLEYQPDIAARELSLRQGVRVGLHVGGSHRFLPYYLVFTQHLMRHLQTDGYRLEELGTRPDGLPDGPGDAVVLFGVTDDDPRVAYLQAQRTPFVVIGRGEGVYWAAPDDYDGARQATSHLLRLGHDRVAHLSGLLHHQAAHDRYCGYRDALLEAGLTPDDSLLLDGDFDSLGAYRALRRVLERPTPFSALFAASDDMAVGAVAALEDAGFRVPTDVSVVGFDDLPELPYPLTTIRQDIGALAAATVTLLKEALEGRPARGEQLAVRLRLRNTTARKR